MDHLFSYGTLQQPEVQLRVFGRKLRGMKDSLEEYKITQPESIAGNQFTSGSRYPIAVFTGNPGDHIHGVLYEVAGEDLVRTDRYEGPLYKRVEVTIRSGRKAWAYVYLGREHIIENTIDFVKKSLADAEGGHDWWHVYRVWKMSKYIAGTEHVNLLVVELGALLHDIADSKFHDGDETIGPQKTRAFLSSLHLDEEIIQHVEQIVSNISFRGGNKTQTFKSIELDIVQDADRLDALGAIGIARAFNYGGYKNRLIYDPEIPPDLNLTSQEYKKNAAPTINHFYEKLLLLKDRMNTDAGKRLASARHQFLEDYLVKFYKEWEGEYK